MVDPYQVDLLHGARLLVAPIPQSFRKAGFLPIGEVRKTRRVMITTEGPPNSGKTEFALSAPGPGAVICLDRGFDAVFDNPHPPKTRRPDFAFKVVLAPQNTAATQDQFLEYWRSYRSDLYSAIALPEVRTVVTDGDSDSWELQKLAEYGKLTQIMPIRYTSANAARRALYSKVFDSGKIFIATNKMKKEYKDLFKPNGDPVLDETGKQKQEWTGDFKRQGFEDNGYLFAIRLLHMARVTPGGVEFGIKIKSCKPNMDLEGEELWGGDCNFASLVQVCYPNVDLKEWGY